MIFNLNNPLRSVLIPTHNRMVREIILILTGITLLALSAQFVIPLKPVPLTFQSATVVLLGMLYGSRLGAITVLGYLLAGSLGLPVFASLSSGITHFTATTAGYLIGFAPAAWLGGFLAERGFARTILGTFVGACLSAAIIFALGVAVLAHFIGLTQAVLLGCAPFMLTEPLKLLAVALVVPRFWKAN